MSTYPKMSKIIGAGSLVLGMVLLPIHSSKAGPKYETIEAQAFGTGTQMGQNIGVTLNIYEFSTPADRANLVDGLREGSEPGIGQCTWKDESGRPRRDNGDAGV